MSTPGVLVCPECGAPVAIPYAMLWGSRSERRTVLCPNGHEVPVVKTFTPTS